MRRAYYRKAFHSIHKKILEELRKPDDEKLDSVLDDLFDTYKLLLEHFGEEVNDKKLWLKNLSFLLF